jgi:hypothetical protein
MLTLPYLQRQKAKVERREALINLLVHADYAESQASLILHSPEGYNFRNPGDSRVSVSDLFLGDRSEPRNLDLVRMFRFIGLADEGGTGMPKIIRAWRQLGFQLPKIDVGTERYEFEIRLRHAHLIAVEDRSWLRSLRRHWTEPEQLALVIARHEGEIDNLRLRTITGLHSADVTKVLGSLRTHGFLQIIGGGRNARYELSASSLEPTATIPSHNVIGNTTRPRPIKDRIARQLTIAGLEGLSFRDLTRRLRDKSSEELRGVLNEMLSSGSVIAVVPQSQRKGASKRYTLSSRNVE